MLEWQYFSKNVVLFATYILTLDLLKNSYLRIRQLPELAP